MPKIFERADFSKPKPNFNWEDLDQEFAPIKPPDGVSIKDIQDHYNVKASRAQQIARECVQKGLLRRIAKGWYVKP